MSDSSTSTRGKKTRNRLRLSCVECTRRRQKCDRQLPCGSCTARGVTHLCHWESVPVARPAPGRPRVSSEAQPPPANDSAKAIQQLSEHIVMLEQKIELLSPGSFNSQASDLNQSEQSSNQRASESPGQEGDNQSESGVPLAPDVQEAVVSFAQLSLAHHGEYIGRGTVVSALNKLGHPQNSLFKYSKSTDAITTNTTAIHQSSNVPNSVPMLVLGLPSRSDITVLANGFFDQINWRFGVPEQWFRAACSQMWDALDYPNGTDINANWLSLLYSVLAFAIKHVAPLKYQGVSSEGYFLCALSARRLAEDNQMASRAFSPLVSAADGSVLSCLAAPLLCHYHADAGRVSEAWKLVGNAIRAAQAVGMHRDPGWTKWQIMSEDERLLRTRAWWGLVTWDQLYSYILGRPAMTRKHLYDVKPAPAMNPDGSQNLYNIFETSLVQLSDIVGETIDKCLGMEYPTERVVFELDRKFKGWESGLPSELRWNGDRSKSRDPFVIRQSYILITWYLASRMKLHLSFFTQPASQHGGAFKQSREECVELSMQLLRIQHWRHAIFVQTKGNDAMGRVDWCFEGTFSLFDAAVTLVTALAQTPMNERRNDAEELVEDAKTVLNVVVLDGTACVGEMSRMAAGVLNVLGQEGVWKRGNALSEDLSVSELSPEAAYARLWFQSGIPDQPVEGTFDKPHPSIFLFRPPSSP